MTAQLRYSFGKTDLSNLLLDQLVLPQDRSVRLSTFSGTFIKDTRDKPLDAHRGFYSTTDYGVTSSIFGASADFHRLLTQNAYYKPLPHGIVFANNIRLGLAKAFSGDTVPTSERFFAGGATTLRGFALNSAGPQRAVAVCATAGANPTTCPQITIPIGGNELFILNSEMRFPLPIIKNLGAVLFYDGGNVYQNINFRQFIDNYTNTVGFGIRYNTPVGPVRLDFGQNLNPVTGQKSTQYFVTLGQAF
jgi:outer membrane protein insertion porin family